ncbi:MAG: GAF domain-containing protein [Desulfatirhabdiaceae bacterium]
MEYEYKEGEDYPYYETTGFSDAFVLAETHLCALDQNGQLVRDEIGNPILECMCGNVISNRFDPSLPFFTGGGSFWTNSTSELLATTTEADRQARTRNRCNGEGDESVALIPLKTKQEIFGLIQLNDSRKDRFTPDLISLLERITNQLTRALGERKALEALQRSESLLKTTESLGRIGGWEWDVFKQTMF